MLYGAKALLMKKVIEKKQRNQPFNYQAGESFSLKGDEDWTINNSYYFSAHGSDTSFYCRLGIRNIHSEVWFYYSDGKKRYSLKRMLFKQNCPLSIYKTNDTWHIQFYGQIEDEQGNIVDAKFDGEFASDEQPIDFFSNMPPIRTAKAMAFEKWNKQFFAEVQRNNQVHYEQTGSLHGTLILNKESIKLSLPCVRDHSYGKRDWNYMNNHLWMMAVNEHSQLNFSMVSYPAMTMLEVGNFKAKDKSMAYILKADYDRSLIGKGVTPEEFAVTLKLTDKSNISVKATIEHGEEYIFQDGQYRLIENIANFEIDSEKYRGIFEIGFNGDKSRWFNSIKERKLKS